MYENLNGCPLCNKPGSSVFLEVADHFLTKEQFTIRQCSSCGFRYLDPRPTKNEIGKYYQSDEYISHDAEKKDLISRIYKIARKISIKGKYRIISSQCKNKGKILDLGCGTGEFLAYCQKNGFEVAGIEPSEKARDYAGNTHGIPVEERLDLLSGQDGSFDVITLWHVLEHIHDLRETMERLKTLLKPDGLLVIAVPNSDSWDAKKYRSYWAAYDVPRHLYHFTKETVNTLVSGYGLNIDKILPQKMDAFYVSMLSEKYLRGKTSFPRFLMNGFWSNLRASGKNTGYSSQIFLLSHRKP